MFTSKRGRIVSKQPNSDFKSRNKKETYLSVNTSMLNDQYASVTKVRNPNSKMFGTFRRSFFKAGKSFYSNSPRRSSPWSNSNNKSKRKKWGLYENNHRNKETKILQDLKSNNLHTVTMFLKTLEMISLHWKIINPNLFRHRLKQFQEVKREFGLLPKFVKESYFYDAKTIVLSWTNIKLQISDDKFLPMNIDFNHAASKLQLSLMNLVNFLNKINLAWKNYEKTNQGFFTKLWTSIALDTNPINDIEFHLSLYEKIRDFDQNFRSLEIAYIQNIKKVRIYT